MFISISPTSKTVLGTDLLNEGNKGMLKERRSREIKLRKNVRVDDWLEFNVKRRAMSPGWCG